jgi:hypothetical protein
LPPTTHRTSPSCSYEYVSKSQKRPFSGPDVVELLFSPICSLCFTGRANGGRYVGLQVTSYLIQTLCFPHAVCKRQNLNCLERN